MLPADARRACAGGGPAPANILVAAHDSPCTRWLVAAQVDTSTSGTQWGTGGMATKLTAGRIATAAGCRMVICSAAEPGNILKIIAGERIGTLFHPTPAPIRCAGQPAGCASLAAPLQLQKRRPDKTVVVADQSLCASLACCISHLGLSPWQPRASAEATSATPPTLCASCHPHAAFCSPIPLHRGRKRWILSVPVRGEVWLDEGARRAVQDRKKSLFSAGIVHLTGDFEAQVRAGRGGG